MEPATRSSVHSARGTRTTSPPNASTTRCTGWTGEPGTSVSATPISATVAVGDFAFDMGLTASAVVLAGDGLSATITTSAQTAGTTYTVTVTGVSDTMGTAIAGMNTAMFAGFMPAGMGVLIVSEYVEGSSNNKAIEIANVGAAFAGAGFLLVAAVPTFLAFLACKGIAFAGLCGDRTDAGEPRDHSTWNDSPASS